MSRFHFVYAIAITTALIACGSGFLSGDGSPEAPGTGGAGAVSSGSDGGGGAGSTVAVTQGPATTSAMASASASASSSVSSSASTSATTASSSTAASSSSSGGGPTPEQLYAMYCSDKKVNAYDDCDAAHANCHVVVAASCAFKCDRKYCVTVWVNHFCGVLGDCLFVGSKPHSGSTDDDAAYCCY